MNADNQVQADRARGIEVVSSPATKEHKEHAGMQENGCAALRILGVDDESKVILMYVGALSSDEVHKHDSVESGQWHKD